MSANLSHRPSHRDGNLAHRPSHRAGNLSHRPSHAGVEYLRRSASAEDWKESSFPSYFWLSPPNMSGEEDCGGKKRNYMENKTDDKQQSDVKI